MNRITLAEAEFIAHELASQVFSEFSEPMPSFHTRFVGRLESCLDTPFQSFGGKDLYGPKTIDKAPVLFYLVIKNHPFENGNKRMAVTLMLVFLYKNGYWLKMTTEDLYQLALDVATSSPKDNNQTIVNIRETIGSHLTRHNRPTWL